VYPGRQHGPDSPFFSGKRVNGIPLTLFIFPGRRGLLNPFEVSVPAYMDTFMLNGLLWFFLPLFSSRYRL
jgi:hypothetical protein